MITVSNLAVDAAAPGGTLIGLIRVFDQAGKPVACSIRFRDEDAGAFFGIVQSNGHLVTTWTGKARAGFYAIHLQANAINVAYSDDADFVIQIR